MNKKEIRTHNILDGIYDYHPINKPFTALSLIHNITCIKDRTPNTQHSDILKTLNFGIENNTVTKQGKKFILINSKP